MTRAPGRVQSVLLAPLDRETLADRAALLDRECAAEEGPQRRVEALLIAHDQPESRLDRPFIIPVDPVAAARVRNRPTEPTRSNLLQATRSPCHQTTE